MSRHDERERTLALAGIFQAARLVRDLARQGKADEQATQASIASLFAFAPETTEAVFGGTGGTRQGLETLVEQIEAPASRDLEIARYVIALLHHGDKLRRDRQRLEELGRDLEHLNDKQVHFDLPGFSLHAQLARLYQRYISPVPPPIMVKGEPLYLQNPKIADDIRACLLAGLRSVVLWRQCGGKRWQLLLGRRRLAAIARSLLEQRA